MALRPRSYDAGADVLYLHVGDPADAVDFDSSDEGHHLHYDAAGRVVGLTIVNARWLLERDGGWFRCRGSAGPCRMAASERRI